MTPGPPAARARCRPLLGASLLWLLLAVSPRSEAGRPGPEQPFPTTKTQTLREDFAQYFVEGRQVIPKNVKIVSLRQMTLVGVGESPTLVVEGVLDLRAVTGGWARLENLVIELAPSAKELVLMDVELGRGARVAPSEEGPAQAKVSVINSRILRGAELELEMEAGKLVVMGTLASGPISLRGAMRSETMGSKVEAVLVMNGGPSLGLRGGLLIEGAKEVTLRLNDLAGDRVLLENNEKLSFDANNVRCATLEFRHERAGRLPKAKIEANDFRCRSIHFIAPAKKQGKVERVQLSKCWFGGETQEDAIREAMIVDSETHPESGILVRIREASEVPLGLGGALGR